MIVFQENVMKKSMHQNQYENICYLNKQLEPGEIDEAREKQFVECYNEMQNKQSKLINYIYI